ncbi:Protein-L-isoaspartate O-methyltransferase [bacterium HR40]|nr:Protein-L-isoaspartate O-methyltransferase [bacterium HR40]
MQGVTRRRILGLPAWLLVSPAGAAIETADFAEQRAAMVRMVQLEAAMVADETGIGELDPRVLAAMREVPRHLFLPEPLWPYAYAPQPLPVHPEQNLAAPFIAALMLHLGEIREQDRVFETGTDVGYQAALAARLARRVYSVELLPELAEWARGRLAALGVTNVEVREGDGFYGWPEEAPFDVILVKEAVSAPPEPLVTQLATGGRLVAPVGSTMAEQWLSVGRKEASGRLRLRRVLPVRFSPLQGGERT